MSDVENGVGDGDEYQYSDEDIDELSSDEDDDDEDDEVDEEDEDDDDEDDDEEDMDTDVKKDKKDKKTETAAEKADRVKDLMRMKFFNPVLQKNKVVKPPSIVVRKVDPDKRVTSHIIQDMEIVEAIGIRCSEIENNSPIFVEDIEGYTDPIAIATKEFYERKSPLVLQRCIEEGDGYILVEEWLVREMTFPKSSKEINKILRQNRNPEDAIKHIQQIAK